MSGEFDQVDGEFIARLKSLIKDHPNPADATSAFVRVAYEVIYDPWDQSVLKHAEDIAKARQQNETELLEAHTRHVEAMAIVPPYQEPLAKRP